MQVLTIDLKRNPDVEALVVDKEPGDLIDLHCSIKVLDAQTLTLTLDEAEEGKEPAEDEAAGDENAEGEGETGKMGTPGMGMGAE